MSAFQVIVTIVPVAFFTDGKPVYDRHNMQVVQSVATAPEAVEPALAELFEQILADWKPAHIAWTP